MNSLPEAFATARLDQAEDTVQESLAQFDDEALLRALRTVNWNPRDVANFLRNVDVYAR